MTTYNKYRVRCITDNKYEYWILSEDYPKPTKCSANTSHTIDPTQTVIVETIKDNLFTIKEETIPTGGNFGIHTLKVNALQNKKSSATTSFPFPISAMVIKFVSDSTHVGDCIELVVGEDTVIGAITTDISPAFAWVSQNYTIGETVIYNNKVYTCILDTVSNEVPIDTTYWQHGLEISVGQTVIDNTEIGYHIKLSDGVNTNSVDRVIKIDTVNNKIYVETNLTNSFTAATPTYVKQSVYTIKDYEIGSPWEHIIGLSKIGGSYVPSNTPVTVYYDNKSPSTDKTFIGRVEFLY